VAERLLPALTGNITQQWRCGVATRTRIDPDATVGDLVGRLKDDSRRLVRDEIRLAKMEIADSVKTAGRGALWMGIAFGTAVLAMVALAVLMATGFGRLFGTLWVGTLVAAALLIVGGGLLAFGGIRILSDQPYTLDETRAEIGNNRAWLKQELARDSSAAERNRE
jgi:uncharacterized membrane protein YqjE